MTKDSQKKGYQKKGYQRKPERLKLIAEERIFKLFKEADAVFGSNKALANRYVEMARRIAMKFKLSMPKSLKRSFCKSCFAYLKPGKNCTVRLTNNKIIYHCLDCNGYMRYPYMAEKRANRAKKAKNRGSG